MRSCQIFLLVYVFGSCFDTSSARTPNENCTATEACGQAPDPTSHFFQCVGLPSNATGRAHLRMLKGTLETAMDVYTFMKSSMRGVPLLSLEGALAMNPEADPLHNEALVQMWMEVKIRPLLKSITKQFLTCLSTKSFSCSTYQTVVRELSLHYSEMNPARQKWIYTFFMYPFLSGDSVNGCVGQQESSEEWLMKNFGAFTAMARMKDFSTLNLVFSGLEVLHLLSPAQKAELLLMPEVAALDNGTLSLVFNSLLTGGPPPTQRPWTTPGGGHNWTTPGGGHNWTAPSGGHNWTAPGGGHNWTSPGGGHNWTAPRSGHHWTTPGSPATHPPHSTYDPYSPPSPHNNIKQVVNGLLTSFKPVRSFVHDFVSFTKEREVSEIRSTTLVQFLLNWTLAELADQYRPRDNSSSVPEKPDFDVTNVEDWFQHVVMPVLARVLPNDGALMHENVTMAFHQVFYLDHIAGDETSEIRDVCSITLDRTPCGLTDAMANMANVLHCAARTNLTMSEETVMKLITELTKRLNSLMKEMATMNFKELASDIQQIFGGEETPSLTQHHLQDPDYIKLWFQLKMLPLLPDVSAGLLSCLSTHNFSCSVYQTLVGEFSKQQHDVQRPNADVYHHFIVPFLMNHHNNTSDPSCSSNTTSSGEWLQKNLGVFSVLASFQDLQRLYSNFSAMTALPQLTVNQLAEVSATPGQLTSPVQVVKVMNHVPDRLIPVFFDDFSPAIAGHESLFPPAVTSAMLQVVFDRANLSSLSVNDSVVSLWLHTRLRPLLVGMSLQHVAPFFSILEGRNCSIEQLGVTDLNSTISSLSQDTQKEIHNHIVQMLKGPVPLHCYGDNHNRSFYGFLEGAFMGFQFPNLTTIVSLMPPDRMDQLVNSISTSGLADLLSRPDVIDDDAELCVIYDRYDQTPKFLETESLPAAVRRPTLPCVWPMALSSSTISEVDAWFEQRLSGYLDFLTGSLIGPSSTYNASCLAFQKLVSVLGRYNYTDADFNRMNVFSSIKDYLTSASAPRCYNSSNPDLNSTAWFFEYIGPFITFLTLDDLLTFGSPEVMQVFTVNLQNIAMFNHSSLPTNLTDYYTELVYQENPDFNPLLLPLAFRCVAPGPAFSQLTSEESMIVLHNLTTICTDLDPQISAALAGNLGDDMDATAISALGNESTGMSTSQIMSIKPQELMQSLNTLGSVMGWNEGQAKAIVQILMTSGALQVTNASSLLMLGSLVVGVPSNTFSSINGSQLYAASTNPEFMQYITAAPEIVQETFVSQIISMNSNSDVIIQNVPDQMATQIPRTMLLSFSSQKVVIQKLNKKKWKRRQVELFFDMMAVETATATLGSPNNLSSSVLQGFTCTSVRTIQKVQIRKLIKACRRKKTRKVKLVETQLTCMYNYIKGESDATTFDLYPPDMLLYYDYSLVPPSSCRSYFEQLADADFSVFSSTLRYKIRVLFDNARSCLGITNSSLTEDNISVLGSMCCTLDGSYIENSDPSILGELQTCNDLNNDQATAVQALLQSGNTQYGAPSTWNQDTLKNLGMLPLYFTSTFFDNFNKKTKRRFLKYFLKVLRQNGVSRQKKRRLKREIRKSIRNRSKRSISSDCTVGQITQVTISDETFPFDYDEIAQFNSCLSAAVVRDNLDAITQKLDQEEYLEIVLRKLREAYAGNSTIPEYQVQVLGPASRVASVDDINLWTMTQVDTLSSLMDSSNGVWNASLAKAVVSKYLSYEGNKLGSSELNAITGSNLCSLDQDVLKNITEQSLREADALDVSSCSLEKKKVLFLIARAAFGSNTRSTVIPASEYQLTEPYVGGAGSDYVRSLTTSNISMNMDTFTGLDESVVLNLTVPEVQGLLGTNVAELKSYENQTLVQSWISTRLQSELDTLGLGITGGKADNSTTAAPTATAAPTTANTATAAPTTANTATAAPTTANTATAAPTTANTATGAPTTANTATAAPTTANTATAAPTTANTATGAPTTANTATAAPTTANTATGAPTTANTATAAPTTANTATGAPTTANTATGAPTTANTATGAPTTANTATGAPTTANTATAAPTTANTATAAPTTANTATAAPTTANTATAAPTTANTATGAPTTANTATGAPTTANTATAAPTTANTATGAPTTANTATGAPTTANTATGAPTTAGPTTVAPTTTTTTTVSTTTTGNSDRVRADASVSFLVLLVLLIASHM